MSDALIECGPIPHPFIEIDGLDRVGKETQTALLQKALANSQRVTFPNYGKAWSAEFVRATLMEQVITVQRFERTGPGRDFDMRRAGDPVILSPKKHPYIFQMWQSADRLEAEASIREMLATGPVLADRYKLAARAYGLVDGCDPEWLMAMERLYLPVDMTFVFIGKPFPRPGEKPDLNERDPEFLAKVRAAYLQIVADVQMTGRKDHVLIDVDRFRQDGFPLRSKHLIHKLLCTLVRNNLGIRVKPLELYDIEGHEAVRLGG